MHIPWSMREELPGDAEGSAVHEIQRGAIRVFPPGRPDVEQYKWQLVHPVWALEPAKP